MLNPKINVSCRLLINELINKYYNDKHNHKVLLEIKFN